MRTIFPSPHDTLQVLKCIAMLCILCLTSFNTFAADDIASNIELRGQWRQGGLVTGQAPIGASITLNAEPVLIAPTGHFLFGFGRDEPSPAILEVTVAGQTWSQHYPIEQRHYKIQKIEGIAKTIMQPNPQNQARASQEATLVRQARAVQRIALDYLMGFQWPAKGPITGVYGSQRFYNGVPGRPHYGVDVAGPVGTPVYAPAPGQISLRHDDMFYSGGTLIIDHGLGLNSTMIHLSKIHVQKGDRVKAGDLIAEMGASGRATGPHLDWRLNWFNTRLDPALVAPARQ